MKLRDFKIEFNFYTNLLILFLLIFGGAVWADSNGVWHFPEDIRPGIFGSDEGDILSGYTFMNPVYTNNTIYVSRIEDKENSSYFLNLSGRSQVKQIIANEVTSNTFKIGTQNLDDRYIKASEVPDCDSEDGVLKHNSTGFYCLNVSDYGGSADGTGYEGDLFSSVHTGKECTDYGGVPIQVEGDVWLCKFIDSQGASCYPGWTKYKEWSTTKSAGCYGQCPYNSWWDQSKYCATSAHVIFADTPVETCSYVQLYDSNPNDEDNSCEQKYPNPTCYATVTSVGCY